MHNSGKAGKQDNPRIYANEHFLAAWFTPDVVTYNNGSGLNIILHGYTLEKGVREVLKYTLRQICIHSSKNSYYFFQALYKIVLDDASPYPQKIRLLQRCKKKIKKVVFDA
jgi:hypothetical protein